MQKISEKIFVNIFVNVIICLVIISIFSFSFVGDMFVFASAEIDKPIYKGNEQKNNVSLMFNVYQGTEFIDDILQVLKQNNVKATFFVVGTAKTQYMPQIVNRGHAIGLHSTTHNYSSIYADVNSYLADIQGISDIVYNTTGIRSNIIRFPGGSSNGVSAKYSPGIMTDLTQRMQSLGYSYYDWNVSSGDASAARVPAQTIVNNVLNAARGKNSICVLMHDNGGKTTTVDALPDIIEGLDAMGFRFAPITAEVYGFHQRVIN